MRETFSTESQNELALAFLRITVGLLFLIFAEYKVFGHEFTHAEFPFWINKFIEQGAYPFMTPVLRNFVLPHSRLLSFVVAYSELAIGLALLVGLFVRLASIGGILFMLILLFSSDYPGAGAAFWEYFGNSLSHSVFILCFLTFLLGRSEAKFSLSALIQK